jgi:hypothetical protein
VDDWRRSRRGNLWQRLDDGRTVPAFRTAALWYWCAAKS